METESMQMFDYKFKINDSYRPIAEALKEKFKELEYVPVKNVLFIDVMEDKRKKQNLKVYAQISKIPGKWDDVIFQMTQKHFEYTLEIFRENTSQMDREQIIALIYHELRHIQLVMGGNGPKVDIVRHDIEDWGNMVEKLGVNWGSTKGVIPDILADGVSWENIQGPPTLFPADTMLKLVRR